MAPSKRRRRGGRGGGGGGGGCILSSTIAAALQAIDVVEEKVIYRILSGDLTGHVTPFVAPHVEKDNLERYLKLPQESEKDVCVMTWWKAHTVIHNCTRPWLSWPGNIWRGLRRLCMRVNVQPSRADA
jgi:hypothetical protein